MKITIETPNIRGNLFDNFWDIVDRNRPKYENRIKTLLETTARTDHLYTKQTGRLQDATKTSGDLETEINLYVDENKANYGTYVINGHGTWDADPFIENSLKVNEAEINQIIEELYSDSIKEFNR